jgi:enamine deaminase RidA (YjgF/YER057c/UK114 family)
MIWSDNMTTTRTAINPSTWSTNLGFDQGQLIEGHRRELLCSGQDAVDSEGSPQHPGDMAAQLDLALDNLEAVLSGADMKLANVVRLNAYATDMDELLKNWGTVTNRFGGSDDRFVTSLVGVSQLPAPGLMVLLEATAVD